MIIILYYASLSISQVQKIMSVFISKNNMLYKGIGLVQQFNADCLANKKFNMLFYERVYKNGDIKIISSRPELIKEQCINNLHTLDDIAKSSYSNFAKSMAKPERKLNLLAPELVSKKLANLFVQFKVNNAFCVTYYHKDYHEIIAFEHNDITSLALQDYLNNLEHFDSLNEIFKTYYSDIFLHNESDYITLRQPIVNFIQNHFASLEKPKQLLTKRQTDCLLGIVKGMTAKEVALHLGISPRTVEHHLDLIKTKLNCRSRVELIAIAEQLGLVSFYRN